MDLQTYFGVSVWAVLHVEGVKTAASTSIKSSVTVAAKLTAKSYV